MFSTKTSNGSAPVSEACPRLRVPAVDVYQDAEDLVFLADLPGVGPDGVKVEVDEGVLTITATLARDALAAREENGGAPTEYRRAFELDPDLDVARISAAMRNGTLELHLPKAERAKTRKVEVKPA